MFCKGVCIFVLPFQYKPDSEKISVILCSYCHDRVPTNAFMLLIKYKWLYINMQQWKYPHDSLSRVAQPWVRVRARVRASLPKLRNPGEAIMWVFPSLHINIMMCYIYHIFIYCIHSLFKYCFRSWITTNIYNPILIQTLFSYLFIE